MCATKMANDKYLLTIQAAQTNSESSIIFRRTRVHLHYSFLIKMLINFNFIIFCFRSF